MFPGCEEYFAKGAGLFCWLEILLGDIEVSTIKKLISSMDAKIIKVVKANGEYFKMWLPGFNLCI